MSEKHLIIEMNNSIDKLKALCKNHEYLGNEFYGKDYEIMINKIIKENHIYYKSLSSDFDVTRRNLLWLANTMRDNIEKHKKGEDVLPIPCNLISTISQEPMIEKSATELIDELFT